ncbi:hypothetical protein P7K49_004057 [Saguinus oedipus]|uniref:Uncharacterized protein n=1 Tax=Saguinus oedipus TaxID=9490 RepID=A0ABQ9W6Z0_SAGOE|nr:hypothetical protein P7K49_004057 [Saguinus oedipus]
MGRAFPTQQSSRGPAQRIPVLQDGVRLFGRREEEAAELPALRSGTSPRPQGALDLYLRVLRCPPPLRPPSLAFSCCPAPAPTGQLGNSGPENAPPWAAVPFSAKR